MNQMNWLRISGLLAGLFLAVSLPFSAMAGQEGNGGDGVVCTSSGRQTVQMLDLREAESVYGRKIDLGKSSLTADQKVSFALKRLSRIDGYRAGKLQILANSFWQNAEFTNDDLVDIPDSGRARIPAGCVLKQLAIQSEPVFPGAKLYTIDKKLWDLMGNESRAALILHEILLYTVRETNASYKQATFRAYHEDTQRIRYFVGWLASKESASIGLNDYVALQNLSALESSFTYQGLNLKASNQWPDTKSGAITGAPSFLDAGKTLLKSADLIERSAFAIPIGSGGLIMKFESVGNVAFYENAQVRRIDSPRGSQPAFHDMIQIPVTSGQLIWPEFHDTRTYPENEQFNFDENGLLTSMMSDGEFKNKFVDSFGCFEITLTGSQYYVSSLCSGGTLKFQSQEDRFSQLRLYETGEPAQVIGAAFRLKTILGEISSSAFELYRGGGVKTLLKNNSSPDYTAQISGVTVVLQGQNSISFHESGTLKSAVARSEVLGLKDQAGAAVKIPAQQRFGLDPSGAVTCIGIQCKGL